MAKQIIAVDIDDVLAQTNEAVRVHVNRHFGTQHTPEDYRMEAPYFMYWEKIWEVSQEEADLRYEHFKQDENRGNIQPLPGAIDVLRELKKNYELVIITARGTSDAHVTQAWLEKHFPKLFSEVKFVPGAWQQGGDTTKADICKELGVSYLVDDAFEHCELVAKEGIIALLFGDYGWNTSKKLPRSVIRVRDWAAVGEYFGI